MKIAVNFRVVDGPWGGGNRFLKGVIAAFGAAGHHVFHDLARPDLDFILLLDPRRRHPAVTFSPAAAWAYCQFTNPQALVIHRINECDERKGTTGMNRRLKRANGVADHTVFVGDWLRNLDLWQGENRAGYSVIRNGADPAVFNSLGMEPWSGSGPLKLVTHHWGGNWMKGFDVYQRLDTLLESSAWQDRIAFTYIGNLPKGFSFRNARYVLPLDGVALAQELRSHHAYVTGSINEPGGNHQNEGALCGLPLLYRQSGCLPEYCEGFGLSFQGPDDMITALEALLEPSRYQALQESMGSYPHTADKTNAEWVALLADLDSRRAALLAQRHTGRRLLSMVSSLHLL